MGVFARSHEKEAAGILQTGKAVQFVDRFTFSVAVKLLESLLCEDVYDPGLALTLGCGRPVQRLGTVQAHNSHSQLSSLRIFLVWSH